MNNPIAAFGMDRQATFNYRGSTVTPEMDAEGLNVDISAMFDFYEAPDDAPGLKGTENWGRIHLWVARISSAGATAFLSWGSSLQQGDLGHEPNRDA